MSRIAYVNGRYVPQKQAFVHIEDRGYQFADGVYEVCTVRKGVPMEEKGHLDRLERSLRELQIAMPMSRACWHSSDRCGTTSTACMPTCASAGWWTAATRRRWASAS